jgi:hypothetical protein
MFFYILERYVSLFSDQQGNKQFSGLTAAWIVGIYIFELSIVFNYLCSFPPSIIVDNQEFTIVKWLVDLSCISGTIQMIA